MILIVCHGLMLGSGSMNGMVSFTDEMQHESHPPFNETMVDVGNVHIPLGSYNGGV